MSLNNSLRNEDRPSMNKLSDISIAAKPCVTVTGKCKKSVLRARQSGKLHPRFAGHIAFGTAVFVSLMAAATIASHDVPLILGGF
jgi:hypothetical protein